MNKMAPIVIIDDDVEDHMIISDGILHVAPSQVVYFRQNGIEALAFLEELALAKTEISLMVFDLNMPKMGGVELLGKVKADARFKDIPIIMYSTSINFTDRENCLKMGAYTYITKPLSFNDSIKIAGEFLDIAAGVAGNVEEL